MRKFTYLSFLLIFFSSAAAQISIPRLSNGDTARKLNYDSALVNIISHSKVSILFRTFSAWSPFNKNYKIISYSDDGKWHYYYQIDEPNFMGVFLSSMSEDSVIKIWETCKKNNLFILKNDDLSNSKCNGMIYDSHHYEFTIITKDQFKKVSYYAPEFFEEQCPSNKGRKQIINCAKIFKKIGAAR